MAIELRDYQIDVCKKMAKAISNKKRKILLCLPTSAGKTCIFTDFAKRLETIGLKTLIIVDRIELCQQTIEYEDYKNHFGFLTSDKFFPRNITVAMLQTLRARLKQEVFQEWLEAFDVVFFDEIHAFQGGNGYKTICDLVKNECTIIGCSASPFDTKGWLLEGFDEFINGVTINELIEQGYIVKPKHLVCDLFDFSNAKINRITNDYDTNTIDEIVVDIDKQDKVLEQWIEHARNLKTLCFCATVKSAEHYCNFFKLNGIKAEVLSGKTPSGTREQILNDFKNGKIEILFNVSVLVAGYSEKTIQCIMMLNATNQLRRYIQLGGRGLRACPEINKKECLILDFVGNSFRHLELDAIRSYQFAPPKQYKEQDDCDFWECPVCSCVNPIESDTCKECGFIIDYKEDEGKSAPKPKNKKDFERLIKLKSVQQELHDIIFEFNGLPCLVKTEETGNIINGRSEKKWCYGYRENGTPIFKTDKDYNVVQYPYPLITKAKKTNCWYVFHTICINYKPSIGALKYYSSKLRKAKKFLEQIKNPNNKAFVNLYNILN